APLGAGRIPAAPRPAWRAGAGGAGCLAGGGMVRGSGAGRGPRVDGTNRPRPSGCDPGSCGAGGGILVPRRAGAAALAMAESNVVPRRPGNRGDPRGPVGRTVGPGRSAVVGHRPRGGHRRRTCHGNLPPDRGRRLLDARTTADAPPPAEGGDRSSPRTSVRRADPAGGRVARRTRSTNPSSGRKSEPSSRGPARRVTRPAGI